MKIERERRKFVKRLKKKYAKLNAENKKNLREPFTEEELGEIKSLIGKENTAFL